MNPQDLVSAVEQFMRSIRENNLKINTSKTIIDFGGNQEIFIFGVKCKIDNDTAFKLHLHYN